MSWNKMNITPFSILFFFVIISTSAKEFGYSIHELQIQYPELATEVMLPSMPNLLGRIQSWNPNSPESPHRLFQETIQHFNYSNTYEREMARQFREAEIPFKLYSVPNVDYVMEKWSNSYLREQLKGDKEINTLVSKNNYFMYWSGRKEDSLKYTNPIEHVKMPFDDWLKVAEHADKNKLSKDEKHYYFRKNERGGRNNKKTTFIGKDLSIFSGTKDSFFVSDVSKNKGIQCRFGMRGYHCIYSSPITYISSSCINICIGIIAASHFDSGRNMVAMLRGNKRYILNPPESCPNLGIITDVKHPSYRHSIIDWTDIHQAKSSKFESVKAIDTIVRSGEVLYIPSFWFHYIISLDTSIQCNSRSGRPKNQQGLQYISDCTKVTN